MYTLFDSEKRILATLAQVGSPIHEKTQVQVTESLWHAGYFLASNKVGSMGYEVIRHLMGNYQPCQRNLARTEVIERSYSACLGAGQKRQGDKDSIVDSH